MPNILAIITISAIDETVITSNEITLSTISGPFIKRYAEIKIAINHPERRIQLLADAISIKNDLSVKGTMQADDVFTNLGSSNEEDLGGFMAELLSVSGILPHKKQDDLPSSGADLSLDFSFKTKMDDPQIQKVSFSGKLLTDE